MQVIQTVTMVKKQVAVNELGRRIGEDAPHAVLKNSEVESWLDLHDEGMGYKRLAKKFNVSIRSVRDIVSFRRRSQVVAGWKMVLIERGDHVNKKA
jgi:hypothetical protein